ncbi:alpha/beta hydrolase [Polycladidibacter stylochi]|uniref:alpha/beta hydrolase n=1 Tax=Polycladidibacter stylochi TaxID=1807766 RepID=UPI00082D451A|nr:alpha/beta hydrolase [Pseudovibrio stylochi]
MAGEITQFIDVGKGESSRKIAVKHTKRGVQGVLWLSGFKSDMLGSKAEVVAEWAEAQNITCTRMDYSGHGESGGEFTDGTISVWLEEVLAVFDRFCEEPTVVIGSSMGGWMALLLAKILKERQVSSNGVLNGMLLIAPAPDFTEELMWKHEFSDAVKQQIMETGSYEKPSDYDEPYIITKALIEDGRNNLLLGDPIATDCPLIILQGQKDDAVPWQHALRIIEACQEEDVILSLIKDGDHRLSRPQDLELMKQSLKQLCV